MADNSHIYEKVEKLSSPFDYSSGEVSIILAAGHGKRIKSHRSKMLHEIWGVPTVERVYNASHAAFPDVNSILVVGIKASDVMDVIGKREKTLFAYQEVQKGTGHAVQIGLERITQKGFKGTVYVLPGDMGLIDAETLSMFRKSFSDSGNDMMVLTGLYEGNPEENQYGRIVRIKEKDCEGKSSGSAAGRVLEIKEYKDILSLKEDEPYYASYNGRTYCYSKAELLATQEYNSGVYAFDYEKLRELVFSLSSDNAQNEIYITDLISAFNGKGYSVGAVSPKHEYVVMGFNDKSVLKEMEEIYRRNIYAKIKNIIEIDDPDDFYIEESVMNDILEMDKEGIPLDIRIGRGVHIGKGVKLNYNVHLKKNVTVNGNVIFGKNVTVWENALLSTFPHQKFQIGNNVEILWGDIIKGQITIGDGSRIESSVNMTGSDEFPIVIGKGVLIKGTSYIFGSVIENDVHIEHSVIIRKRVNRLIKRNGELQKVRFYLPMPSGVDAVESL
ncbi:MAG: NTP transferase domain-containing protein [Ignavibacteriales bacterium]|nr:Bifunctional protein GlmU [Ignavibacteriaceae bacterium]MCK6613942.1 NTP transferase domain-containing protein [Ignavibacteriaceae bacterium]QOJ30303.1 MAG: NTP transferase domain-containing protein [Ignavibacteriales bacterium]